jgi:magnesium chelatase subunit I
VQGLIELAQHVDLGAKPPDPVLASAVDFVLEGLYAQKKISRSDDRGYHAAEPPQRRPSSRAPERDFDEGVPLPGGKKKYYN